MRIRRESKTRVRDAALDASRNMTLVAALSAALVACGAPDTKPQPAGEHAAPPLTPSHGIEMALASNYGFMSLQFQLGDVGAYVSNFADTARLSVPGYGVLRGRDSIGIRFAGEGKRFGVKDFTRQSAGYRIEGRDVIDSGTFKIVTEMPLPKGSLDSTGRYWTRWHSTEDARWLIISDSLVPFKH